MPNGYSYIVTIEGTDGFILDTDLLDTGVLGYVPTDVTSYVRSVSTKTGRSTIQDKFSAGQMSIVFDNRSRAFDPNYSSSPIYGLVQPRRKIRFGIITDVYTDPGLSMFVGWVDSWSFDYDVSGDSTATASCSDAFTVLSNQQLDLVNPPAETTDLRFNRVMNSPTVAWPLDQAFVSGAAFTMGTASYSGDALSYLQQLADSERGYLVVAEGAVNFFAWQYFTATYDPSFIVFSDSDSTVLPFTAIETSYDTDQFYNYLTVSGYPGTVTYQDTTSQDNYGISYGNFPVLQSTTGQMDWVGTFLRNKYGNPRFRISKLSASLDNEQLSTTVITGVSSLAYLATYCGQYIGVEWTPNGIGSPIYNAGYIIGIDISATPDRCDFTFSISGDDSRGAYG